MNDLETVRQRLRFLREQPVPAWTKEERDRKDDEALEALDRVESANAQLHTDLADVREDRDRLEALLWERGHQLNTVEAERDQLHDELGGLRRSHESLQRELETLTQQRNFFRQKETAALDRVNELEGALDRLAGAYHDTADGEHRFHASFRDCPEYRCTQARQALKNTEKEEES